MSNTWIIGGTGNGSGATAANGGGFKNDTDATFANSQNASGNAVLNVVACDVVEAVSGNVQIEKAATSFSDAKVGHWVYVDFTATYPDDRYEIIVATATEIEINLLWSADTTCAIRVGGALTNPNDAVALAGAGDETLIVNDDGSVRTYTLPNNGGNAAVSFDHASGTGADRIVMRGVNNDGTDIVFGDDRPVLTTNVALSVGMLEFTTFDYWDIVDLVIDGGGVGKADYCIFNIDTLAIQNRFINVKIRNAAVHNMNWVGEQVVLMQFESADSVGRGATLGCDSGRFINCDMHDNGGDGITAVVCFDNIFSGISMYDNGGRGLNLASTSTNNYITNCLAYGNTSAGFRFRSAGSANTICNNTSVGNTGEGYDFEGDLDDQTYFGYNHSYGNSAHYSEGVDGTFGDLLDGNNISGDPLFASVVDGSEDFTPALVSPLIAAAVANIGLAGVSYMDIGSVQRALTAGSAILNANKRGNKQ